MTDKSDDLSLPAAVVTRIIKDALPEGCNIAKEAKSALAKAASVFVLYLTAQANTVAVERNKKTITNRDVLEALQITEFGRFEEPLIDALEQFKKLQQSKKEKKLSTGKDEQKADEDKMEEGDIDVEAEVEILDIDEDVNATS